MSGWCICWHSFMDLIFSLPSVFTTWQIHTYWLLPSKILSYLQAFSSKWKKHISVVAITPFICLFLKNTFMREILFVATFVKCESAMNMHASMYSHKHWYHMCLHDLYESSLWAENWKKKEGGFWQRNSKYDFLHEAYRKMSSCCGGSKGQYAKEPSTWTWMFTMWYFFKTEDKPA